MKNPLGFVISFAMCSVSHLAFAQDGNASPDAYTGGVQDIVVTAQKRAESLQNVPLSVAAYSDQMLEQRGVTNVGALLLAPPPGVFLQPFSGSPNMLAIDIRGVTNNDPGQGTAELGSALYIDDVYIGRAAGLGTELADPERIEILRGPQGTLFGRNAEGGAIRIVTKKPTGEFGGSARVMIGNYDQRRYEGHLNLPEIAGFSIKLDVLHSERGGLVKNIRDSRLAVQHDFGEINADGYRASVRWQPADWVTLDYSYDYSKTYDSRDYNQLTFPPFGIGGVPISQATAPTLFAARPLDRIDRRRKVSWIGLYSPEFRTTVSGHTLQAEFTLADNLTLKSITNFRKSREVGANQLAGANTVATAPANLTFGNLIPAAVLGLTDLGLPAGILPTQQVFAFSGVVPWNDMDQKQASQEFQLIGSTDELEYVAGLYYFHEDVDDYRQTTFSIAYADAARKLAVPLNAFTLFAGGAGKTGQNAKADSYAAFGQATYSPNFADGRLHLTAGLRYTKDKKDYLRFMANGGDVSIVGKPFRESRFDPAFTVAYDFTNRLNTYVRYAQAYRAGGVSVRSPSFRPFEAEVNKSFEAGIKSEWLDRRLRANLAVFQNKIYNKQISASLDPINAPSVTDTINVPGVTRIRGAELELLMAPVDALQIALNYGYLTGRRAKSYRPVDLENGIGSPLEPRADIRLNSLPKHSITASVDYALPEADWGQILLHVDYSLTSKTPGTNRINFGTYAWPVYRDIANARITLQKIPVGPTNLKVALFGKNIFNTITPIFTGAGPNYVPSLPRMYGAELGLDF